MLIADGLVGRSVGFDRPGKAADSNPPQVRAMLGAMCEQLGKNRATVQRLRASLNPFSRFDFGLLAGLPHARSWQAKERHSREAV